MKKIFVTCLIVCVILIALNQSCEARRRKKQSQDVEAGSRIHRLGYRMKIGKSKGLHNSYLSRDFRGHNQEGHHRQYNRRTKKNFRMKNRKKQWKNRQKHPLRAHRFKKFKTQSSTEIQNSSAADLSAKELSNATSATTEALVSRSKPKLAARKTIVGGNHSPCVTTSDCLPGHCCITKPNKGSRCKQFKARAGKKCWDTCMCADGMGCFVRSKRDDSRPTKRIRNKNRKQRGTCKIPETDDVIRGTYLNIK